MRYSIQEVLAAGEGSWTDAPVDLRISGYSLDSRTIKPGELFFAIKGNVQDGHKYVEAAIENGAAAAVVLRGFKRSDGSTDKLVYCEDPLRFLHSLASWSRKEEGLRLVGITGSCGKTTTKDLIHTVLSGEFRAGKNHGNYNNIWGMPISLLRRQEGLDVYVCEMGMSYAGELTQVTRIARPDVAVFTNIHAVHLVNFNSVQDIAEAKAEIIRGLRADGPVVANADDPEIMRISRRSGHELITYGIKNEADIKIISHKDEGIDGVTFKVNIYGREFDSRLRLPGVHNLYNGLAALGAGISMRMSPDAIIERLNHVELSPMRSNIVRLPGLTIYDDAYNSNPEALLRVIDTAVRSRVEGKRIVVAGDMLELGESEVQRHEDCGKYIARAGVDSLITVGKLAAHIGAAALKEGMPPEAIEIFKTSDEALESLRKKLSRGDLLVVKGSRGMRLEVIVNGVAEQFSG